MKNSEIIQKKLQEFEKLELPMMRKLGDITKVFVIDTFNKKGFTDKNFEPWAPSKNSKNELMVRTGDLKRSIKIAETTNNKAVISTDVPYSVFLNDGTSRMTARRFIDNSQFLEEKLAKEIEEMVKKIFD